MGSPSVFRALAKPLDLSVKNVCSGGTPVGSPESWNIR